jgi:hypothetical protein
MVMRRSGVTRLDALLRSLGPAIGLPVVLLVECVVLSRIADGATWGSPCVQISTGAASLISMYGTVVAAAPPRWNDSQACNGTGGRPWHAARAGR